MLKFLAKLFIKTPREYDDPAARRAYGVPTAGTEAP